MLRPCAPGRQHFCPNFSGLQRTTEGIRYRYNKPLAEIWLCVTVFAYAKICAKPSAKLLKWSLAAFPWQILTRNSTCKEMNTYQGSLYISDLDGTLLRNDATLSTYSQKVLTQLLQEGLAFTVASARSIVAIQSLLQGITLSLPVIE